MRNDGRLRSQLRLEARAATVLWAADEVAQTDKRLPVLRVGRGATKLELEDVQRVEPNVLVVDYCELELGGEVRKSEHVYAANAALWAAHGMETNGWMATIQYRDQILARNRTMAPGSGGTVRYRFTISEELDPTGIRLAIETPELWNVSVNGEGVDLARGRRWLDPHIKVGTVGRLLKPGENVVELDGRPFNVRREVDQIYLLGDFACVEDYTGFRLAPPRPLGLGSWRRLGYPFYDREIAYTFGLPETDIRGVLTLDEEDWNGSILLVEMGGEVVARLWEPPYRFFAEGHQDGRLTLRVIGLPKNLLGPWHDPKHQRGRAWIPMWYGPDVPTLPRPGGCYGLLDLGLFSGPRWQRT